MFMTHMRSHASCVSSCGLSTYSWNFFRCNINETLIREVADAMVANGLRDAGYKYVNIGEAQAAALVS